MNNLIISKIVDNVNGFIYYLNYQDTTTITLEKRPYILVYDDKENIKNRIIKRIISICSKNEELLSIDANEDNKKVYSKILSASNYIAIKSRFGPATNILTSTYNFDKYSLSKLYDNGFEIILDDSIEDIYVYRKNSIDQPGLILLTCGNKYNVIKVGSNPEYGFKKIKINKN